MLPALLQVFPARVHPLTLVSDPDNLLADEALLAALIERGFTLIQETDPILLRHRIEQARPFTHQHPVLVITPGALESLPYDLWQQGHRLSLDLHTYFPGLAYPILRSLSPLQRSRLWQIPQPSERLGNRGTVDYLLQHIFDLLPGALQRPAELIAWLGDVHNQGLMPLPEALLTRLLAQLQSLPACGLALA